MAFDTCALVDMRSVVRARFTGEDFSTYRFLLTDESAGVAAFFDCEYRGVKLEKMFVLVAVSFLAGMDEDDIFEVADTYRPPPPASYKKCGKTVPCDVPDSGKGMVQVWFEKRWNAIKGIVAQDSADPEILGDHPVTDVLIHPEWRNDVVSRLAAKSEVSSIQLRRDLGFFFRYGGTRDALLPRMPGRCGAARRPKSEFVDAKKFGRKTTKQRRGRAAWNAKNGATPFWIGRITQAIDEIVERDEKGAWATLRDGEAFYAYFLENCCFETDPETGELDVIAADCIPTSRTVLFQLNRLLATRPKLQPKRKSFSGMRGGYATNLTYGVLDVADIDAATFEDYCLAIAEDETKPISQQNHIQIGTPTVYFGFCRKSVAACGCEVCCNPEYGDPYRYVMFDMLLDMEDKKKRLRELEMDPELLPGIVSGGFDVVVVDRGAGASYKVMQWTVGEKMDIRLTRSGAPMDKGTVEGGIGQIKKWLTKQRRVMCKLIARSALKRIKALPKAILNSEYIIENHNKRKEARQRKVTVLPKSVFVRIIIEAMNEINLRVKKDPRCITEEMQFCDNPPEPTAAGLFNYYQSLRRGTANFPRRETDLRESLLHLEPCQVIGGAIHFGPCWYGSPSSVKVGEPGADRLVAYVALVAASGTDVSRIHVLATRIPGKNLVWAKIPETGEWLLLAPDVKSAKSYGVTRDLSETNAVQDNWCMQKEDDAIKKVAAKTKGALSQRKVAAAERILEAQQHDPSWTDVKHVDIPAQQQARRQAKEDRESRALAAHGLPSLDDEEPGGDARLKEEARLDVEPSLAGSENSSGQKVLGRPRGAVPSIQQILEDLENEEEDKDDPEGEQEVV